MSTTELDTKKKQASAIEGRGSRCDWRRPHYDVWENDEAFNVSVVLPGVNRAGLDITLKDDTLVVVGTRSAQVPEGSRPLRRELPQGDFRLSLRIDVDINEASIEAKIEDGILELTLPKADEVKPRKITVS